MIIKLLFVSLCIGLINDSSGVEVTFSNTQTLDNQYLQLTKKKLTFISNEWNKLIQINKAPANDSVQTMSELSYLLKRQGDRTDLKKMEINFERTLYGFKFDNIYFHDILIQKEFKLLSKFLSDCITDLGVVIHTLKIENDRVRPSFLNPELKPIIMNPNHASYPSGHSTIAYFLGYIFSYILPEKKQLLMKDANRIAVNREIAGVHYPSDTLGGKRIAQQYFSHILKNHSAHLNVIKKKFRNLLLKKW